MPHLQIQSSTTARLTLACLSIPGTMATTELPAVSNDAATPPAVELEQTSELPKELGAIQFHVGADVVKRDIVKKTVSKDSQAEAWQYYLGKRPVQNELTGIPFGFKTNEDGTAVLCAEADGKPLHDWKSLAAVPLSEFADLGTGIKLTFDFMWHTSVFFGIMWLLGTVGWIIQVVDPKDISWVSVTFAWDVIFVWCFAGFMIWLRRDMVLHQREVDHRNINASDYGVQVDGLPNDATEKEIHDYFSNFGELHSEPGPFAPSIYQTQFDETGVYVVRNDSNLITNAYAIIEINSAIRSTDPANKAVLQKLEANRKKLIDTYMGLREMTYHCAGKAFVVYKFNQVQSKVLDDYKQDAKKFLFRGKIPLTIVEAPEPTDLLWRNLQSSNSIVLIRQIVIGLLSFVYLYFVSLVMVYCAAFNKANASNFFVALLGTVGNILCCITSIVLLMPLASVLEGVHTRSMLEVVTFLKLSWFQWAGTIFATFYVYGLDDQAALLEPLSEGQMQMWGTGLPTRICNTTRFNLSTSIRSAGFPDGVTPNDVAAYGEVECWAFTLHLFGTGFSSFLIGNLIGDVLLINMIDWLCPPWWGATIGGMKGAFYQEDLNKAFEGADFHPFLRYQILLKFLMVGMTASCIDNPRFLSLFVAICFIQCYGIEKYNFLLRYKDPPAYGAFMYSVVVIYGLPSALLIHCVMAEVMFGFTYGLTEDFSLIVENNEVNGTRYGTISLVFFFIALAFCIVWILPFKFWEFESTGDKDKVFVEEEGSVQRMEAELTYYEGLTAVEDKIDITHHRNIKVMKYVPDPTRREFGVLKLN